MNDAYNETITRQGKVYHYDPYRDIYYARQAESTVSKHAWIVACIVLATLAFYLEYHPSL
jgi:hypothetical protein